MSHQPEQARESKIAVRRTARSVTDPRLPKRHRAWLFLFLTLGAGAASGLIALVGPPLVTGAGAAITTHVAATNTGPIQASTLFPPVGVQHKVIDVYDPQPPARTAPEPPDDNAPGQTPSGSEPPDD